MQPEPLVSVLMPAYNCADFIGAAIESVLAQTHAHFELLVIDDGSTDDTPAVISRYSRADARLRCITRDHLGLIGRLNLGLAEARGCYLARLDSDDLCAPSRLEVQVGLLEDRPEIVLVGSAYTIIDQQGAPIRINNMPQSDAAIRWHALFHSPFAHSSVMLRLEVLRKFGLKYDPAMQEAEDYELWSRLLKYGPARNLVESSVHYRQHPGQASQLGQPAVREFAGRVSQKNLADFGVHLPLDQIQRLREWYYHFPRRFDRDDLDLSLTLIDILDRFSAQPGLDPKEVQRIRGRWLGRLLRASLFNNKALYFKNILSGFQLDDLLAVIAYWLEREKPTVPSDFT